MDNGSVISVGQVANAKYCARFNGGVECKLPKIRQFLKECSKGLWNPEDYWDGLLYKNFGLLDCVKFRIAFHNEEFGVSEAMKESLRLMDTTAIGSKGRIFHSLEREYPNLFNFGVYSKSSSERLLTVLLGSEKFLCFLEEKTDKDLEYFAKKEREIFRKVGVAL